MVESFGNMETESSTSSIFAKVRAQEKKPIIKK